MPPTVRQKFIFSGASLLGFNSESQVPLPWELSRRLDMWTGILLLTSFLTLSQSLNNIPKQGK